MVKRPSNIYTYIYEMAPPVISIYCGIGGSVKGFKDANYVVAGAIDTEIDVVLNFKRNYPETTKVCLLDPDNTQSWSRTLAELSTISEPLLLVTPPRTVDARSCARFSGYLNALASVLIVPTDLAIANNDEWVEQYIDSMKHTYMFDTLVISVDIASYGSPVSGKRTIVIGINAKRIGMFGNATETRGVLYEIASSILLSQRSYPGITTPRSVLMRHRPSVLNKTHIYLHPRKPGEKSLYSLDEPLPALRNSCVRVMTSEEKKCDENANILFLDHELLSVLIGLPANFIMNTCISLTTKYFVQSQHPNLVKNIAEALFNVDISSHKRDRIREGGAINVVIRDLPPCLSKIDDILQPPIPLEDLAANPLPLRSRMDKLSKATRKAKVTYLNARRSQGNQQETQNRRRKISYVIGHCEQGDEFLNTIKSIRQLCLPNGWSIELKERVNNIHAKEDMYFISPIGTVFRSPKAVAKYLEKQRTRKNNQSDTTP